MAASSPSSPQDLTLSVIGCGTMGIAILSGIMSSLRDNHSLRFPLAVPSGVSTPNPAAPSRLPTHFVACVRRPESELRIVKQLTPYHFPLTVLFDDNLRGVREGDVVILAAKPQMVESILSAPGITDALEGKILISILAGVSAAQIEDILYPPTTTLANDRRCRVIRAMPNTASMVRESMTVIGNPQPPLPTEQANLVVWIFKQIGRVVFLPPQAMDASTALCGSGPAFMALVLEAMADGAVAMGLPRAEASMMAAQTMRGTAALVLDGEHPAILRDKVSTPGGCTIGGLLVLEEGRVRGTLARAVREATVVASQLGRGVEGVNGTRF